MKEQFLYIVFSSTPCRMGAFIRRCTGNDFNHVSIGLDRTLEPLYSFARRYYHTPFYGGFVRETLSRYCIHGQAATIRVFRLPVTQDQASALDRKFAQMLTNQDTYLYNYLSALAVPFKKTVPLSNAYTCIEFCVHILHSIGLPLMPGSFYSLRDLETLLHPYELYTGLAPTPKSYDFSYYAAKPLLHPLCSSANAFFKLFKRFIWNSSDPSTKTTT